MSLSEAQRRKKRKRKKKSGCQGNKNKCITFRQRRRGKSTYSILTLLLVSQGQASMWKQKLGLHVLGKQTKQADMSNGMICAALQNKKIECRMRDCGATTYCGLATNGCCTWHGFRQTSTLTPLTADTADRWEVTHLGFSVHVKVATHTVVVTQRTQKQTSPDMPGVQICTAQITSVIVQPAATHMPARKEA